tara:strand:- start:1201 stop:2445 length:1245 start_codon:yes stop_codon:yes gene_type:complete
LIHPEPSIKDDNPLQPSLAKTLTVLTLETGQHFFGYGYGANQDARGELVFNTSMTGYQEICTDASYRSQIVTLTYPLINNYGTNLEDVESRRPWISGLVVRELSPNSSNWRHKKSLHRFLLQNNIPIVGGIDTRKLVRILRGGGIHRAFITQTPSDFPDPGTFIWTTGQVQGLDRFLADQVDRARSVSPLSDQNLVEEVTSMNPSFFEDSYWGPWRAPNKRKATHRIAVLDCGAKTNILRSLAIRGCEVTLLPYDTSPEDITSLDPAGIVVANGPGDPEQADIAINSIRRIIGKIPIMGICLGHQLVALAIGASTSRLKFGHRGANHPVKDLLTGQVHITSQNHGFQVDEKSIPACNGYRVSHVNLNDGSVEGITHDSLPIFTIQYHPEASPGPQDNQYLFDRFLDMVEKFEKQ